jgi:hypothetical protein
MIDAESPATSAYCLRRSEERQVALQHNTRNLVPHDRYAEA